MTAFKTFLTTLIFLTLLFFGENEFCFPIGSVRGEAEATFFISSENRNIDIPFLSLNGFSQISEKKGNGIFVEIKINANDLRIEKEWRINKTISKKLRKLDPARAEPLIRALSKVRYTDEAAIEIFKFVKQNWKYVEKNDSNFATEEILNLKEASCFSLCRICKFYFDIIEIHSEVAIGIKFPTDKETLVLKGGALHSWLKIKIDKDNQVFCDPLSFFGFVTQRYIYLCNEENFKKDRLQNFKNATVTLVSNRDRIFYNPESEIKPLFWKRSPYESSIYGIVVGKVLKEKDLPAKGSVIVKGFGNNLKLDLFQGNFYFFAKEDGKYSMFIISEDENEEKLGDLVFSGSAVKKVVYYVKEKT